MELKMYDTRKEYIENASGPLPPFIEELRDKIRTNKKTETRRVIKHLPRIDVARDISKNGAVFTLRLVNFRSPYGDSDQIRYLREPLYRGSDLHARYKDDDVLVLDENEKPILWRWKVKTLSQLFMPRIAGRTFVHQSSVRFEQVQDITESSARSEGVEHLGEGFGVYWENCWKNYLPGLHKYKASARGSFASLWDSINKKRGFDWDSNPWVWVLKFSLGYEKKDVIR